MFAGRENELKELERLYKTKTFQMVIIYGRRRIGKSTLITWFTRNKRSIFFTATETDSKRNLEAFSRAVMKLRGGRKKCHSPAGSRPLIKRRSWPKNRLFW